MTGETRPRTPSVPARSVFATPREPDTLPPGHAASAAGARARTSSPRRPNNSDENLGLYLSACDEPMHGGYIFTLSVRMSCTITVYSTAICLAQCTKGFVRSADKNTFRKP